jgi:SAM-dependent methyltransferase
MTDYIERNRALWSETNRQYTDESADKAWTETEITWGIFEVSERTINVIGDVHGRDVIELGCGTAYFSAWLARRGARPVGVDLTPAQLATARRCQTRFELAFPLVEANAEQVPLPDASFDLAISEYGASLWCEPARWLPEAARLLRPGGRLIFLTSSLLFNLCVPESGAEYAGTQLLRAQSAIRRLHWPDGGVEFHPSYGEWITLLRTAGFSIEGLHELYAPPDAKDHEFYRMARVDWAQRWPVEEIWVARKT